MFILLRAWKYTNKKHLLIPKTDFKRVIFYVEASFSSFLVFNVWSFVRFNVILWTSDNQADLVKGRPFLC